MCGLTMILKKIDNIDFQNEIEKLNFESVNTENKFNLRNLHAYI